MLRARGTYAVAVFLMIVPALLAASKDYGQAEPLIPPPTELLNVVNSINYSSIRGHVEALVGFGTRFTGSQGCENAAQYIHDAFTEYSRTGGMANVTYHHYDITVPQDHGANITVNRPEHGVVRAYPLLPNGVATTVTPPRGITGRLVYVRGGELSDLGNTLPQNASIRDSIVLMDFNSLSLWVQAAKFGAKAVVFMEPTDTTQWQAEKLHLRMTPFNYPRLYISRQDADYLITLLQNGEEVEVTLKTEMRWKDMRARNVIGVVPGTLHRDRYVLIGGYYDSTSVVPSIAPGASEAVNTAILLELARFYSQNPAKNSIILAAFSGHHQFMRGSHMAAEHYMKNLNLEGNVEMAFQVDISTENDVLAPCELDDSLLVHEHRRLAVQIGERLNPVMLEVFRSLRSMGKPYPQYLGNWFAGYEIFWVSYPFDLDSIKPLHPKRHDLWWWYAYGACWAFFDTAFATDRYQRTPLDTTGRVNFNNVPNQVELAHAFIYTMANQENIIPDVLPHGITAGVTWTDVQGRVVRFNASINWYEPVPNAIVMLKHRAGTRGTFDNDMYVLRADENGSFRFPRWSTGVGPYDMAMWTAIYKLGPNGEVLYALDRGIHSVYATYFIQGGMWQPTGWLMWSPAQGEPTTDLGFVVVFECASMVLFDNLDTETMRTTTGYTYQPQDFTAHYILDEYNWMSEDLGWMEKIDVLFVQPNRPVEVMLKVPYQPIHSIGILNNASEENPYGTGYVLKPGQQITIKFTDLQYAKNFHQINRARLKDVEGMTLDLNYRLFQEAEEHINMAEAAVENNNYLEATQLARWAWHGQHAFYVSLVTQMKDVLSAVPFFTGLIIPFGILLQALVARARGYRRLTVALLAIVTTSTVFYLFHPGFRLSANPPLVIVAFSVIILTLPALAIIYSGSYSYFRRVSEAILGPHRMARAGVSILPGEFTLGIENIKRRKLRSALSFTSIVIITTSLTMFTSMSTRPVLTPFPQPQPATYDGVLIGSPLQSPAEWSPPTKQGEVGILLVRDLMARYGNTSHVAPRAWFYPSCAGGATGTTGVFILVSEGGNASARAAMVLTPQERDVTSVHATLIDWGGSVSRWFEATDLWAVIVPDRMAEDLGMGGLPARISMLGMDLTVVGVYDSHAYFSISDLDNQPLCPADPRVTDAPVPIPPDEMIILPYNLVRHLANPRWFGFTATFPSYKIVSVAVRPINPEDVPETSSGVFGRYLLDMFEGHGGRVRLYTRGGVLEVSGLQAQVVPMVILGLTLFNVMLGSVYERTKDIFIYSSVGLSPRHVSLLFVVEAFALSVMASMTGYLIAIVGVNLIPGQLVTQEFFSLNISSSRASSTLLIAIGIAMLSTVFPVIKAGRIVTPSLERVWRIPTKPRGDEWDIPLPFVAPLEEAPGAVGYMEEFFSHHAGREAPTFMVTKMWTEKIMARGVEMRHICFEGMLEPYSEGIRQRVRFYSQFAPGRRGLASGST